MSHRADFPRTVSPERAAEVAAAKGLTRVAVVLPARNEAATVGGIVAAIRADLVTTGVVDEVVVMDSDSTDGTAAAARAAGATVHATRDVAPHLGSRPGKGEALWKAQFACAADVFVFLDADLRAWGTHFVTDLLGPLLVREEVALVKGRYARPTHEGGGGRVTELVARPLLALHAPDLAHVAQPLGGEWAIRADLLAQLELPTGYAVDLAVLLGARALRGVDAIAQVDLGVRDHAHQDLAALGAMSAQLLAYVAGRRDALDLRTFPPGAPGGVGTRVPLDVRPAAASLRP